MIPEKICDKLKERFGEAIVATAADAAHPHATVALDKWREVAEFLHGDAELRFNFLRCVTALDLLEDNKLAVVFDLHAMHPQDGASDDDYWELVSEFAVRVEMDRDDPHVASVADIWTTADWHEREAYDLMGIVFDGHPDSVLDHDGAHPRRILCPDDWLGHPLRKDYLYPMEYHGIPGTTEHELTSPRH